MIRTAFRLGRIVATPGALAAMKKAGHVPAEFLNRHANCDWGDVTEPDAHLNNEALEDGSRIMSSYSMADGKELWIITEAADENGHRLATTILLPSEY